MKLKKITKMNPITNNLVIGCLFDDGNCCYKQAIEKYFNDKIKLCYCFGINKAPFINTSKYIYIQIDLSIFNKNLIKILSPLQKPDIILASPPCESWSNADTIKNYQPNSLTLNNYDYFLLQNQKFYGQTRKQPGLNFFNKQRTRLLGEATQLGLNLIIRTFAPKYWVIENPASSKCWLYQKQFLNFNGIENKTYYSCYEFPIAKPTIFKSNIDLALRKDKVKSQVAGEKVCGYNTRSNIPLKLIKEILEKIV